MMFNIGVAMFIFGCFVLHPGLGFVVVGALFCLWGVEAEK